MFFTESWTLQTFAFAAYEMVNVSHGPRINFQFQNVSELCQRFL